MRIAFRGRLHIGSVWEGGDTAKPRCEWTVEFLEYIMKSLGDDISTAFDS